MYVFFSGMNLYQSLPVVTVPCGGRYAFDAFWNALFHGYEWPTETYVVLFIRGTYVVLFIRGTGVRIFCNHETHDEKQAIKYIDDVPVKDSQDPIVMYMNYSPCTDCARYILRKSKQRTDFRLDIHVAGLYKIKRKSCSKSKHSHKKLDDCRVGDFRFTEVRKRMRSGKTMHLQLERVERIS